MLEAISKPIQRDHKTGKVKEGLVNLNMALVPDNQASKIPDPGKGALDFPPFPVAPEFSAVLRLRFSSVFTMRRNQINFKLLQPLAQRVGPAVHGLGQGAGLEGIAPSPALPTLKFMSRYFRKSGVLNKL